MNDAQQELSPDFVLMRLVSAAEYDRLDEPEDLLTGGFGPVKAGLGHRGGGFDVETSGPSPGLGSASPHYSSPLPGKGELDGGLLLSEAPPGSESRSPPPQEDFTAAAQRFVDFPVPHGPGPGGPGSRAQLMVFQNLLRSGDRILECGLEPTPPGDTQRQQLNSGPGPGPGSTIAGPSPGGGKDQNPHCAPPEETLQPPQWHSVLRPQTQQGVPALHPESGSVLCHRHRVLTDRLAQWPPALLDQALRLGLLEPRKNRPAGGEDPVLALARRLGQLGEGGGGEDMLPPLPRCSCHSVLASGTGGEDPSPQTGGGGGGLYGPELPDLAGCPGRRSVPPPNQQQPLSPSPPAGPPRPPDAPTQHQSRSQPQSRATTPKFGVASGGAGRSASPLVVLEGEGEKTPRGKSRKGGSLKVRLSKLFRTKSSSGGPGGGLDKRPSLSSSTSSGGSLLDVWGSSCSNTEPDSA
eukprot:superscaffoldBa00009696_g24258